MYKGGYNYLKEKRVWKQMKKKEWRKGIVSVYPQAPMFTARGNVDISYIGGNELLKLAGEFKNTTLVNTNDVIFVIRCEDGTKSGRFQSWVFDQTYIAKVRLVPVSNFAGGKTVPFFSLSKYTPKGDDDHYDDFVLGTEGIRSCLAYGTYSSYLVPPRKGYSNYTYSVVSVAGLAHTSGDGLEDQLLPMLVHMFVSIKLKLWNEKPKWGERMKKFKDKILLFEKSTVNELKDGRKKPKWWLEEKMIEMMVMVRKMFYFAVYPSLDYHSRQSNFIVSSSQQHNERKNAFDVLRRHNIPHYVSPSTSLSFYINVSAFKKRVNLSKPTWYEAGDVYGFARDDSLSIDSVTSFKGGGGNNLVCHFFVVKESKELGNTFPFTITELNPVSQRHVLLELERIETKVDQSWNWYKLLNLRVDNMLNDFNQKIQNVNKRVDEKHDKMLEKLERSFAVVMSAAVMSKEKETSSFSEEQLRRIFRNCAKEIDEEKRGDSMDVKKKKRRKKKKKKKWENKNNGWKWKDRNNWSGEKKWKK